MATFKHSTAGSTFIMPDGKVLRFHGKIGSDGYLETENEGEIAQMRSLARNPQVQVEEVGEIETPAKPVDPTIAASAADAASSSLRVADPKVEAAQNGLAALIASNNVNKAT